MACKLIVAVSSAIVAPVLAAGFLFPAVAQTASPEDLALCRYTNKPIVCRCALENGAFLRRSPDGRGFEIFEYLASQGQANNQALCVARYERQGVPATPPAARPRPARQSSSAGGSGLAPSGPNHPPPITLEQLAARIGAPQPVAARPASVQPAVSRPSVSQPAPARPTTAIRAGQSARAEDLALCQHTASPGLCRCRLENGGRLEPLADGRRFAVRSGAGEANRQGLARCVRASQGT